LTKKRTRRKYKKSISVMQTVGALCALDAVLDLGNLGAGGTDIKIPVVGDLRRGIQAAIVGVINPDMAGRTADVVGLIAAPTLLGYAQRHIDKATGRQRIAGVRI